MDPRAVADYVKKLCRDLDRECGPMPFDLRGSVASSAESPSSRRGLHDQDPEEPLPGTIGYASTVGEEAWRECFDLTDATIVAK